MPSVFFQLISYGLVGCVVNCLGYSAYIFITYLGVTPKIAITFLYAVVSLIGFFANRHFTFRHDGRIGTAGIRYLFAQLLGYFLNLIFLFIFVDCLGFAHYLVQAFAIVVVAIVLFMLSRFFVFVPQSAKNGEII